MTKNRITGTCLKNPFASIAIILASWHKKFFRLTTVKHQNLFAPIRSKFWQSRFKIIFKTGSKIFSVLAIALVCLSWTSAVFAQGLTPKEQEDNCKRLKAQFVIKGVDTVGVLPKFCTITDAAQYAINWALAAGATVAVVFIILGGFWLLTSAGSEEQAEKGRKILTNSVIGLIVIIMAFAIVRIVVSLLTGDPGDVTKSSGAGDAQTQKTATQPQSYYTPGGPGDPNYKSPYVSGKGQPAELYPNQPYLLTLTIPSALTQCAAGTNKVYVKVTKADGTQSGGIQPQSLQDNSDSVTATFLTGSPMSYGYALSGNEKSRDAVTMPITGFVCGTQAYQDKINVIALPAEAITVSPRGGPTGGSAELAAAVKNANFSIIVNSSNKTFTVYVFGGGANNVKALCTDPSEAGLRINATNIKKGPFINDSMSTDVLASVKTGMSAPVKSGIPLSDYDPNSVRVFICGNEIFK